MIPTFSCAGRNWIVQVNLGGVQPDCAGFVSLYLYPSPLSDSPVPLRLGFAIFAGESPATGSCIWSSGDVECTIPPRQSMGWPKTAQRAEVIRRATDDTIAIRVTIKMHPSSSAVRFLQPAADIGVPRPTLGSDIGALFESGAGSDAVLKVGERCFRVHRLILGARSSVMKAMFDGGPWREATTSAPIELPDVEADTMAHLLRFIYSGSVAESVVSWEDWGNLLVAADRFDVRELFLLAQAKLGKLLTPSNSCETLALCGRITAATQLKSATLDFVAQGRLSTDDLERLDPDSLREIIKRNAHVVLVQGEDGGSGGSEEDEDEDEDEDEEYTRAAAAGSGRGKRRRKKSTGPAQKQRKRS